MLPARSGQVPGRRLLSASTEGLGDQDQYGAGGHERAQNNRLMVAPRGSSAVSGLRSGDRDHPVVLLERRAEELGDRGARSGGDQEVPLVTVDGERSVDLTVLDGPARSGLRGERRHVEHTGCVTLDRLRERRWAHDSEGDVVRLGLVCGQDEGRHQRRLDEEKKADDPERATTVLAKTWSPQPSAGPGVI
jgi:hypothetical protein